MTQQLKPEDLLAATLAPSDAQKLLPADQRWWPDFPQFYVPPFTGDPKAQNPGQRFLVGQNYERLGRTPGQLAVSLTLFDDPPRAKGAFASLLQQRDAGGTIVPGPAVGDERRYYARSNTVNKTTPFESVVRFRRGPVVAKLTLFAPDAFEQPDTIGRFGNALDSKVQALVSGGLHAPALPAGLAGALPPPVQGISPVLGTAVRPAEAWAVQDSTGNPEKVLAGLKADGASDLGYRAYGLQGNNAQTVEVILFPLKDAASATKLASGYRSEVARATQGKLDPGKTGQGSAYSRHGAWYELMFAAGRYVGDVTCRAPFGTTSAACEAPVRQLSEAWFATLAPPASGSPAAASASARGASLPTA